MRLCVVVAAQGYFELHLYAYLHATGPEILSSEAGYMCTNAIVVSRRTGACKHTSRYHGAMMHETLSSAGKQLQSHQKYGRYIGPCPPPCVRPVCKIPPARLGSTPIGVGVRVFPCSHACIHASGIKSHSKLDNHRIFFGGTLCPRYTRHNNLDPPRCGAALEQRWIHVQWDRTGGRS